jgi:hypothetical protein
MKHEIKNNSKIIISGVGSKLSKSDCFNSKEEEIDFDEFDKFLNESDYIITMLAYALVIIFLGTTLLGTFLSLLVNSYGNTEYLNITSNFFIAMLFGEIIAMLVCILFVCLYSSFVDVYSSFFSDSLKLQLKSKDKEKINEKLKTI